MKKACAKFKIKWNNKKGKQNANRKGKNKFNKPQN